jgi:frataxin
MGSIEEREDPNGAESEDELAIALTQRLSYRGNSCQRERHSFVGSYQSVEMWKTRRIAGAAACRRVLTARPAIATVPDASHLGVAATPARGNHTMALSRQPRLAPTPALGPYQQHQLRGFKSEAAYHKIADDTLEGILDAVEQSLEAIPNIPEDMEIELAAGVLTMKLPPHGTWVLNKQTPNQQIWWSSPLSGPKRFEYADGLWFATQTGLALVPLLSQELSHVLKTPVELEVE